jgi:hypothetical protein
MADGRAAVYTPSGTGRAFWGPGDVEKDFEEVFEPVRDRSAAPPPTTKELIDRLVAAAPGYGLEFVLPAAG